MRHLVSSSSSRHHCHTRSSSSLSNSGSSNDNATSSYSSYSSSRRRSRRRTTSNTSSSSSSSSSTDTTTIVARPPLQTIMCLSSGGAAFFRDCGCSRWLESGMLFGAVLQCPVMEEVPPMVIVVELTTSWLFSRARYSYDLLSTNSKTHLPYTCSTQHSQSARYTVDNPFKSECCSRWVALCLRRSEHKIEVTLQFHLQAAATKTL